MLVENVDYKFFALEDNVNTICVKILNEKYKDVVVSYDAGRKITKVQGNWSETIDFFGLYQHKLDFTLNEEL